MIEIDEIDTGLYVTDVGKNELRIETEDWQRGGEPVSLPHYADEVIAGCVSKLSLPEGAITIENPQAGRWSILSNEQQSVSYEGNDFVIKIGGAIDTYVRFSERVTIERHFSNGNVDVVFPRTTPVTIGFRSGLRTPTQSIIIPPTIEGVATGLSYLSVALETASPDKSYPSLRRHPPTIEFGEEESIPREISERLVETGIRFRVPPELDALFVLSPLIYYLQAEVITEQRSSALLELSSSGITHRFQPLPTLQHEVAELLRMVFSLDCLVRNAGPYSIDLSELSLLQSMTFDAETAYHSHPADRLAVYLDTPFERIESELPDWHLAMYVDPTLEHVPALSHHLDHLGQIYLPDAEPLEKSEFLERSLNESYRSSRATNPTGAVDAILPRLQNARIHGWMADGAPIDAFKTVLQSYDNQPSYLDLVDESKVISVVLNASEMESEQEAVTAIYEDRAKHLSIDLRIERELDTAGLEDVLTSGADFVHYIGHCTSAGLQCTDGHLSVEEVNAVNAQTFFLNACGS